MNALRIIKLILIENIVAAILTAIAIILITTSFFIPPIGKVEPSSLQTGALILGFASLWTFIVSMYKGKKATMQHGNTTISVEQDKN